MPRCRRQILICFPWLMLRRSIPNGPAPARNYFETSSIGPQERAAAVEKIVQVAQKRKLTTAGIYATAESVDAILNSRGLVSYHTQTSAECSITMLAPDSSGWQKANSPDARNFDPVELAEVAAEKAKESAGPKELPPGKYTVILEPAAVLDLLGFMFWDWGGQAILDERSFLNNRVGTKLFGENISITDDVYHPLQSGAPFDGEGVRKQQVKLVENGVVTSLVYARGTAEKVRKSEFANKLGPVRPTGHGFPIPNEVGEAPMNIVISGGADGKKRSIDEMVKGTEDGILVTRLWYIREVDPYEKILTGMTRDGTFHVKGGQIFGGIRNFRFNQSVVDISEQCSGDERTRACQWRRVVRHGGAGDEDSRLQFHGSDEVLIRSLGPSVDQSFSEGLSDYWRPQSSAQILSSPSSATNLC